MSNYDSIYKGNRPGKRDWYYRDTRTLTLKFLYGDSDEQTAWTLFKNRTNLDDGENGVNKEIFIALWSIYGYKNTISNTKERVESTLKYWIQYEGNKIVRQRIKWDGVKEDLYAQLSEVNNFNIGDIKEDPDNFDKFKNAKQTQNVSNNILLQITQINQIPDPLDAGIQRIYFKLFIPHQREIQENTYE